MVADVSGMGAMAVTTAQDGYSIVHVTAQCGAWEREKRGCGLFHSNLICSTIETS
jgi:hypothetical protein